MRRIKRERQAKAWLVKSPTTSCWMVQVPTAADRATFAYHSYYHFLWYCHEFITATSSVESIFITIGQSLYNQYC